MKKVFTVAKYEFLSTVKKKMFLFMVLIIPLIAGLPLLLSSMYLPGMMNTGGQIGFIDDAGILTPSGNYLKYADIGQAKTDLLNKDISFFFVVGADYLSTGNVTVYTPAPYALLARTFNYNSFLVGNLLGYAKVDPRISARITNPSVPEVISLNADGSIKPPMSAFGYVQPFILSFLLLLTIITSSNFLMQGIGEEKESRTDELLLSSISAEELLQGKIIGYASVGLVQLAIWIALAVAIVSNSQYAPLLSQVQPTWQMGLAVVYFLLGYTLFSVSIACAAAISPTAKEAQQTSSIFTMLAVLPMAFSQFIILAPDSPAAKALTIFPYTAPFVTMMRSALIDVPAYEIVSSIVVMLATILLVAKVAAKIFRMGMLMQGKKASLKEVMAFVREK